MAELRMLQAGLQEFRMQIRPRRWVILFSPLKCVFYGNMGLLRNAVFCARQGQREPGCLGLKCWMLDVDFGF